MLLRIRCVSVCLVAGLMSMSGCVLPLAPDFQDPPASQNFSPRFVQTDPAEGSVVKTSRFSVTVTDPNIGDDLHFRWIADYPPANGNERIFLSFTSPRSTNGMPQFRTSEVMPDCLLNTLAKLPSHRIMVIVADREFADPVNPATKEVDFTRVQDGGLAIVATWTLDVECR
jgi:hypothetical protein